MSKILLIQSRTTPERIARERENFARVVGDSAQLDFLSALDERLAWTYPDEFLKYYDGVIFGGSSDFDLHGGRDDKDPARLMATIILSRTKLIVQYALAEERPIFGVCFGHQLIAEMHGGEVRNDAAQSKFGKHEVRLTEEGIRDGLFSGLAPSFEAEYQHKDSVTTLPKGASTLAAAPNCRFSALRYAPAVYTVQFHPELRCGSVLCGKEHGIPRSAALLRGWARAAQPRARFI